MNNSNFRDIEYVEGDRFKSKEGTVYTILDPFGESYLVSVNNTETTGVLDIAQLVGVGFLKEIKIKPSAKSDYWKCKIV